MKHQKKRTHPKKSNTSFNSKGSKKDILFYVLIILIIVLGYLSFFDENPVLEAFTKEKKAEQGELKEEITNDLVEMEQELTQIEALIT